MSSERKYTYYNIYKYIRLIGRACIVSVLDLEWDPAPFYRARIRVVFFYSSTPFKNRRRIFGAKLVHPRAPYMSLSYTTVHLNEDIIIICYFTSSMPYFLISTTICNV